MGKKTKHLARLSCGIFVVSLASIGMIVSAQWGLGNRSGGSNSNAQNSNSNSSSNTASSSGRKANARQRTHRSARHANTNAKRDANASTRRAYMSAQEPTATNTNRASGSAAQTKPGRCDPEREELTDLSGIYTGSVNYPNDGLMGDATLTIDGNRFTLSTNSKTETGRIAIVTTCDYTAVAMMFGEWKTPQPGETPGPPLPMLSLRAFRTPDHILLKSSPSEKRTFSFETKARK